MVTKATRLKDMEWSLLKCSWIVTVFVTLLIIHSSHATILSPLGTVNEPLGTGGAIPGEGELTPPENEVVPGEGEIIPRSQLEGENLHNPNPQTGSEHPGEETLIDRPVGSVNTESPNRRINEAPRFISVTDGPQIDGEGTLSIRPLKPTTRSGQTQVLTPTPSSNVSENRNDSQVTTGDRRNSSSLVSSHTSDEIPRRETLPDTATSVGNQDLQTCMSSSSIHIHTSQIVPTRVVVTESTSVDSNDTDIQIPLPDSDLRLTSRPIVEETDTVRESMTSVVSSVNEDVYPLDSSEYAIVESRAVPQVTLLETQSLNTNNYTASSYPERGGDASQVLTDESVFVISSTSVFEETDMVLSSKDRKMQDKPPKSTTDLPGEQTEGLSSEVVLTRTVLSEQTISIQDITSSSVVETEETTTILPTFSIIASQSVTAGSSSSAEPIVVTLPSGSHEIVIQKNSTLSVVGTTTPSTPSTRTSSTTSRTTVNLSASDSTTSSKAPTSNTSSETISRTPTSAPYTGDVTLPVHVTTLRTTFTTKRKVKPPHGQNTSPSTNTTNNDTVTESPETNNTSSDNRKKTGDSNTTSVTTPSTSRSSSTRTMTPMHVSTPHHIVPSTKPPVFAQVKLRMSWRDFCRSEALFRNELQDIFHVEGGHNVSTEQIMLMDIRESQCLDLMGADLPEEIMISFYLVDVNGNYDEILTVACENVVTQGFQRKVTSYFYSKLVEVKLNTEHYTRRNTERHMTTKAPIETEPVEKGREGLFAMEPGITIAIVIASVGGACCIALIILQVVMRRRNKRLYLPDTRHHSFTSMDSIAMASVTKSRPNSGLFNPGLDQADMTEPFFPVNFAGLANKCLEPDSVKEEFQFVPNYTPKLSTVPVGAEDKNRYANVIPVPQTRVKLKRRSSHVACDYINANFVTGFGDDKQAYIATQAPLDSTVADFWRMVWEQQSRVIIMLTAIKENGHPKCAHYWPDCLGDSLQRYGDFMIHLKKKDVHQEYIISILELKDIENNLVREVKHCWYTCWPINGTPEPISLVKFILDTRVFYEDSGAPLIVHCSPGTGRTGTLIAIDICMRQYENRRIVDILNTVYRMRQERAGCVQTKEQYMLIYNALNEYASVLRSPAISTSSSSMTLHNIT